MSDWREKSNRREAFIRWFAWSTKFKDCDPAVWLNQYLNFRFEHNSEQRYWLAWLYGHTYQFPTAWVLMNEFPDFERVTLDRLNQWNSQNYTRLRYQTDTKWNKGHLPEMFDSYKRQVGTDRQEELFNKLLGDNEFKSFNVVYDYVINHFHKFGRYMTWYYLQHLKHTCQLNIEPVGLMLNDWEGSRSHRNGLLYALGRDNEIDIKLTNKEYDNLEDSAKDILEECRDRFPTDNFDLFTMETCLCSFKKLFRTTHGRYLGYYLDRQAEEIQKAESDGWDGIEWNVLWQARKEYLDPRLDIKTGVRIDSYKVFMDTGKLMRSEWLFNDEVEYQGILDLLT